MGLLRNWMTSSQRDCYLEGLKSKGDGSFCKNCRLEALNIIPLNFCGLDVVRNHNSSVVERDGLLSGYASYRGSNSQISSSNEYPATKETNDLESSSMIALSQGTSQYDVKTVTEIMKAYIVSAFILVLNTFDVPCRSEGYSSIPCAPAGGTVIDFANQESGSVATEETKKMKDCYLKNYPISNSEQPKISKLNWHHGSVISPTMHPLSLQNKRKSESGRLPYR